MKPTKVYTISDHRWRSADFSRKAFTPYALALGQSTLAWNNLHERLCDLFNDILFALGLDTPEHTYGLAIWNSATVDRAKRKMLEALINSLFESCFVRRRMCVFPKGRAAQLQAAVGFILKEANSLEDARNNAVHAPIGSNEGIDDEVFGIAVTPMAYLGNQRAGRMVGKDLLAEYRYLRDGARILACYTNAVMDAFLLLRGDPVRVAWPPTPKMPGREPKKGRRGRHRQPPAKSHARQPRSSRA